MLEPDPAGLYERLKSTLPEADRTVVTGDFAFDAASAVAEALVPGVDGWIDDQFSVCAPWGVDLDALSGTSIALWHGDADLMVPFAHGAWLAERIPNARAHLKRGEGHMSIGVGYADAILEDLIAHAR